MKTRIHFQIQAIKLSVIFFVAFFNQVLAQTITPSPTPIHDSYPGGHVGLRGGATPAVGLSAIVFNKLLDVGDLKNDQGSTIAPTNQTTDAIICVFMWTTKYKILGMNYGGFVAIPFDNIYSHPPGGPKTNTGFALANCVAVPFALYGKSKNFDYQVGLGYWLKNAKYTYGGDDNHGAGFAEMVYSLGAVYYLKGNRKAPCASLVWRIEQPFKQETTDIKPGGAFTFDYGISSRFLPLDKKHRNIMVAGVSGFATTQFYKETGTYKSVSTDLYRQFATGPEVQYFNTKARIKILLRAQWQYGARNTTQGATYWVALGYSIPHKAEVKPEEFKETGESEEKK